MRIFVLEQLLELFARLAALAQAGQCVYGRAPTARRDAVARAFCDDVERAVVAQRCHAVQRSGTDHVRPGWLIHDRFEGFERTRLPRPAKRARRVGGDQVAGLLAQ